MPRHKVERAARREVFTALGEIKEHEGKHVFVPSSPPYLRDQFQRLPIGHKISATFSEYKARRSGSQLRYHMVIMGYLAAHTGYTKREMHDAVMKLHFGVKEIEILGRKVEVRRSMADDGDLEKHEVVELITYDKQLAQDMGVKIPTAEELGYLPG